ncbi:MAG: ABC transporter ATP-binding protein, partial [Rhodospirillaceae bacterium]
MTDTTVSPSPGAASAPAEAPPVLELRDLAVSYVTRAGEVEVLPGLSFSLRRGEALGLVGESGCGKSTAAYAAIRYLGQAGRVRRGQVLFEGTDLYGLPDDQLRSLRGNRIAMVYQDPMSSLNPTLTVGQQLTEVMEIHGLKQGKAAWDHAVDMLSEVKLPDPERMMERYPHQLSGGQQQRVVIAMALMAEPALLILDEPTTGLDVTVEAAVLDLIRDLRKRHDAAIIFISHNLGTVVRICDRIGVMYAGELVEEGPIEAVFDAPCHPYTRGLLCCVPTLSGDKTSVKLEPIKGM